MTAKSTQGNLSLNASTATAVINSTTFGAFTHAVTGGTQYTNSTADVIIQNVDASATVYIGTSSSVTSSTYGYKLAAGQSLSLNNILPTTPLYAISSGTSSLAVLAILK